MNPPVIPCARCGATCVADYEASEPCYGRVEVVSGTGDDRDPYVHYCEGHRERLDYLDGDKAARRYIPYEVGE